MLQRQSQRGTDCVPEDGTAGQEVLRKSKEEIYGWEWSNVLEYRVQIDHY